jgi:hypothetical protein
LVKSRMAELPDISVINILQSFVCRNHTRFIPCPQNKAIQAAASSIFTQNKSE